MSVMSYELVYISSVIPQRNLKLFTISPYLQNNLDVLKLKASLIHALGIQQEKTSYAFP